MLKVSENEAYADNKTKTVGKTVPTICQPYPKRLGCAASEKRVNSWTPPGWHQVQESKGPTCRSMGTPAGCLLIGGWMPLCNPRTLQSRQLGQSSSGWGIRQVRTAMRVWSEKPWTKIRVPLSGDAPLCDKWGFSSIRFTNPSDGRWIQCPNPQCSKEINDYQEQGK